MSFVATAPAPPLPDLPRRPFWPAINPGDCREVMQLDGTITNPRLIHALTEAVVFVNSELRQWRLTCEANGCAKMGDVPDEEPGRLTHLYCRAVYEQAAADLMERYIRFDATNEAQSRAEQQMPAIENHRRNAFWAIRDILGQARSNMELI
jgi:hypothetical protein